MYTCRARRRSAVGVGPLQRRNSSMRAVEASPVFFGSCTAGLSRITRPAAVSAAWRPTSTRSSRELAPRRLLSWTSAPSFSPAAANPGALVFSALRTACVFPLVGVPPMLPCTVGANEAGSLVTSTCSGLFAPRYFQAPRHSPRKACAAMTVRASPSSRHPAQGSPRAPGLHEILYEPQPKTSPAPPGR